MECLKPYLNASLFLFLLSLDRKAAQALWGTTCPHCGRGILHWGSWRRKFRCPVGFVLPADFDVLFSLCCSAEGCRKRTTPSSIRFPFRSPNLAAVVILAKIFVCGPSSKRVAEIQKIMEVDERTVRRWLARWRNTETSSAWWQKLSGFYSLSGLQLDALWDVYAAKTSNPRFALAKMLLACRTLWDKWRQ